MLTQIYIQRKHKVSFNIIPRLPPLGKDHPKRLRGHLHCERGVNPDPDQPPPHPPYTVGRARVIQTSPETSIQAYF